MPLAELASAAGVEGNSEHFYKVGRLFRMLKFSNVKGSQG